MGPPQPKTVTHMHPEPVSEVFLTGGKILRQTHYGTTPRESSPMIESSGESVPVTNNKPRTVGGNSANVGVGAVGDRKEMNLNLDSKVRVDAENKAKSPYMLIKSPSNASKSGSGDEDKNVTSPECQLDGSNANRESLKSTSNYSNLDVTDHKPSPKLMMKQPLFDDNEDDSDSMFHESDANSEISTAEEEEDSSDATHPTRSSSLSSIPQQRDLMLRQIQSGGVTLKSRGKSGGSFIEFPKIKEENVERIEYLTPKEVKAMQVARRRRAEWELKCKTERAEKTKGNPHYQQGKAMDISENHFDDSGPVIKSSVPSQKSGKGIVRSKNLKDVKKKSGNKHLRNQMLKRLVQNSTDYANEDSPSSTDSSDVKVVKKVPIKTVDQRKNPSASSSNFKPVKIEQSIPSIEHPLQNDSSGSTTPELQQHKVKKSDSKTLGPDFNRAKKMGHRRMKSAPLRMASFEENTVESELTPENPFVYISPAPVKEESRARSQSLGNKSKYIKKGRNELSRLAELVVQEDRRDVDRDELEVLQV